MHDQSSAGFEPPYDLFLNNTPYTARVFNLDIEHYFRKRDNLRTFIKSKKVINTKYNPDYLIDFRLIIRDVFDASLKRHAKRFNIQPWESALLYSHELSHGIFSSYMKRLGYTSTGWYDKDE